MYLPGFGQARNRVPVCVCISARTRPLDSKQSCFVSRAPGQRPGPPQCHLVAHRKLHRNSSLMATPQISSRYHFQADLKGLRLPITFEIPIMPDSSPSEEHLGPSHSRIFRDKDSDVVDLGAAIQQPQGVITDTPSVNTEPLETDSHVEDLDLLSRLSVSKSLRCAFAVR